MKEKFLKLILFASILFGCTTENENISEFTKYKWETTSLLSSNIDSSMIEKAFSEASKLNYIYSILVIRNGKIVAERYFNGNNKDSFYKIKSVSKSYLSAALGIAIDKNILSQNDKLMDILSKHQSKISDIRFLDVTIGQLIKMRSGLDGDRNIYSTVVNSSDWISTILGMTLINNPGSKFVYTTPGTHLLSAALTESTGKSSLDFVNENLTSKMGIELNAWERDPQGIYFGGNNMYFTTRNMAVLGLLYLNDGIIGGVQIVPSSWVKASLVDHTGGIGSWGVIDNVGYGFLWWVGNINNFKIFTAIGHGGQFVLCVPELDLIVATNAYSDIWWEQANLQELAILNIIGNFIIPSVMQ